MFAPIINEFISNGGVFMEKEELYKKIASCTEKKEMIKLLKDLLKLGEPINLKNGYVFVIDEMPGEIGEEVSDDVIKEVLQRKGTVKRLSGSGDFRTEECIKYMKECDICCTNPPFSLFSELFALLTKYEKKYLLIGNQNAITYKEIFNSVHSRKRLWTALHIRLNRGRMLLL